MSSIDEKVVKVSIDDAQFQKAVDSVIKALADLKKSLQLEDSTKGFDDLNKAANKVKFDGIVDNASDVEKSVNKATTAASGDFADLGADASKSLDKIDQAASNVDLTEIGSAAEKESGKVQNASADANASIGKIGTNTTGLEQVSDGLDHITQSAANVDLSPVQKACASVNNGIASVGETASNVFSRMGMNVDTSRVTGAVTAMQGAVDRFSTSNVVTQIDGVTAKLSTMQMVGVAALTTLMNKAIEFGQNSLRGMTEGIRGGLSEYELQLDSIQTILANTARYGTTVDQVNASLSKLNTYADKTIYSFSDMTKNISLFTNAGIRVEDATSMIKGFSNEAAASGTNATSAAGAAYQLSQALQTGSIKLMDWRSLTNVGMGNKNMQDGLIQVANAMGTVSKAGTSTAKIQSDFNETLTKGWLTSDVMSNYLKIMAGDMDDAGMSAIGLSKDQINAFKQTSATAQDAATKTKSFTQLIDQYHEAIGSGWSTTWQYVFGDFEEAKEGWSSVNDKLQNIVTANSNARNAIFESWHNKGGTKEMYATINDLIDAWQSWITPIKKGFAEVFQGGDTGAMLFSLTQKLHQFAQSLILGGEGADTLQKAAKGVALVIKALLVVLKLAFSILKVVFEVIAFGVKIIVQLIAAVVRAGEAVRKFAVESGFVEKAVQAWNTAFETFKNVVTTVTELVLAALNGLGIGFKTGFKDYPNIFALAGDAITQFGNSVQECGQKFNKAIVDKFGPAAKVTKEVATKVASAIKSMQPALDWIADKLIALKNQIKRFFGDFSGEVTLNNILSMFNSGVVAVLLLNLNKLVKGFLKAGDELKTDTIADGIKKVLGSVTDSFKSFQESMSVGRLLIIAAAVSLLTFSLIQLSKVEPKKIAVGLGGLASVFTMLVGSLAGLSKMAAMTNAMGKNVFNFAALNQMAVAMVGMGIAMSLMSKAAYRLKDMDPKQLATVVAALAGMLISLAGSLMMIGSIKPGHINAVGANMTSIGIGFIAISAALLILATAIARIATVKPEALARTMKALAQAFIAITFAMGALGTMKKFGADYNGIAASILGISAAIAILSVAIKNLGGMEWDDLKKGLVGITVGLLAMSSALVGLGMLQGFGGSYNKTAASLIAMAVAMNLMVIPIRTLGSMDMASLAKGLGSVIILLGTFAAAMSLLAKVNGKFAGLIKVSASILAFAVALNALVIPIKVLGGMDIGSLTKGLAGLGALMAGMVASFRLMPTKNIKDMAVGMIAFAAALNLMVIPLRILGAMDGKQLLSAMVGLYGAITAMAVAARLLGPVALQLTAVSKAIAVFGLGILALGVGVALFSAGVLALAGSASAVGTIITTMLDSLIMAIPALMNSIANAIDGVLKVIVAALPSILDSLSQIVEQLIEFLIKEAPALAEGALVMIDEVLKKVANHADTITDSLVVILVAALNAVANHAPEITAALGRVMGAIFQAIADGINNADPGKFAGMILSMGMMAVLFKLMAKMKKDVVGALMVGGSILLLMIGLVGVFALMSALKIENVLTNAAGMALVMASMTAVFMVMSTMKSKVAAALIVGTAINVVLAELALVFGLMEAMHVKDVLPTALGMSVLLLAISGAMAILALIPMPAALSAVGSLAIFIAGLAAIILAAGAIKQIPGVDWLMGEGADMLAKIGSALGGFVGSIVKSALSTAAQALPDIGTALSDFMTNLKPFIDGAKTIDGTVAAAVDTIANVVLKLTASSLLDAIAGFITGKKSFEDLGTGLVTLGQAMVDFGNVTKDLDPAIVAKAAICAQILVNLQNSMQSVGGLVQAFTGIKDWSSLSNGLVTLGRTLAEFGNVVDGLKADAIAASIPALQSLISMQNSLQSVAGIAQYFTGVKNWDSFSYGLVTVGRVLRAYGAAVDGMNIDAVTASVPALQSLISMQNSLQSVAGIAQYFTGVKNWDAFSYGLATVGRALAAYSGAVANVKPEVVAASIDPLKSLIGLQSSLENTGGVSGFLFGDKDLSSLGENLKQLGTGIAGYASAVGSSNFDKVTASVTAVKSLNTLMQGMNGDYAGVAMFKTAVTTAGDFGLSGFGTNLQASATSATNALNNLNTSISDGNTRVVNSLAALKTTMSSATFSNVMASSMSSVSASVASGTGNIKTSFTALSTYLSGFVASWKSGLQPMVTATSSTMDSIIGTINGFKPRFSSAGKSLANELSDGLKSGQNGFKGAFNDALDKAVSSARSYHDDFHSAGAYLVSGFSSGIRDNIDKAAAASAAMAKASSDAAKKNLDINSPSRVFRKFGNFVGMGFVLGQQDQMANVAKASTKLTDSAIDAVTSSLSAMNSMDFNDAMKVSPTITPVLDLSNAQRGMNGFLTQGNSITSSLSANIGDITYRNPEAQAMSDYRDAITQSNSDVAASIASLRSDMGEYTNAVKNQETILQIDSKTVAKATAKPMNQEMGTLSRRGSLG